MNWIFAVFWNFSEISEEVIVLLTDFDEILCIDSCGPAGVCTIWLGFETDPDQSSDPRTGFTPNF